MSRPLWFVNLLRKAFPSRYLAARATRLPLLGDLLEHWLFEGDDLFYLPSNHSVNIHEPIPQPDELVLPSQVVEHFIERAEIHWIMNECICRTAEHCSNFPSDLGCLFLGEAALGIHPGLGRQVTRSEALEHVEKCRQAGLIHLIGRNKLDTVWLGVGPGHKLLTICNCCPCCCLWRVIPHVSPSIRSKITRMPGVQVRVSDQCIGCGTCIQAGCFMEAIRLVDGQAVISEACRGCGRCVQNCPNDAIELRIRSPAFVEQAIARIAPLVDIS